MGWAIRQSYMSKVFPSSEHAVFLLGRYNFSHRQPEHMQGYVTGVFNTRKKARDWLAKYKARYAKSGDWNRQWCKGMTVVQVKVTVKEVT